jgi:hypothetical protein
MTTVAKIKKKTTTGRPTKYSGKKTLNKTVKYLSECFPEPIQRIKSESKHNKSYVHVTKPNLPTMEGLGLYLGIARSTLYEWKSTHTEFSDLLDRLLAQQEHILLEYGLSGEFNASIVKLILSARHGYQEQKTIMYEDAASVFDDDDD